MESFSISQARGVLGELLNRVRIGRERIVLSSHGKSVGAIVSMQELRLLQMLESQLDGQQYEKAISEPEKVLTLDDLLGSDE